jgi:hypothetical protein
LCVADRQLACCAVIYALAPCANVIVLALAVAALLSSLPPRRHRINAFALQIAHLAGTLQNLAETDMAQRTKLPLAGRGFIM